MSHTEEQQTALIPRNFIERGTFMGGMFKIRNAIEGAVLAIAIALPVIHLPLSVTVRIILLCMTALPAAMVALIGIGGESLTAFLMNALRYVKNRRILYRLDTRPELPKKKRVPKPRSKEPKTQKKKRSQKTDSQKEVSTPGTTTGTGDAPVSKEPPRKKKNAGSMIPPPSVGSENRPGRTSVSLPMKKNRRKEPRRNP
ncbi:hypothetical protein BRYFOR_08978 [Marvinbryantia formatexigens DSM 14469]|uniref:PrgI family protein n=1 Tax=Marvinbryantia formatexigens DSM 14469 TaxID=478749 RepID=C6LJZ1_9FIRM|nr:hypothetical protein [Marvinbryantia formatexigens]EET59069.1 hypothetical protein BRYFOR_08978 [Marvinbryantia formatexigens DSM 14469]